MMLIHDGFKWFIPAGMLVCMTAGGAFSAGGNEKEDKTVSLSDIKTELPALRFPVSMFIDDPAPCINPLYYYRRDCDNMQAGSFKSWEAKPSVKMVDRIPLEFCREFGQWVRTTKVKGKFTILPFPAGLGDITRGLDGFDVREVKEWLAVVKKDVAPSFDITPEILTHTRSLDIRKGKLTPAGKETSRVLISAVLRKRIPRKNWSSTYRSG